MTKYNAKPVIIDGIRFASTLEGDRWRMLRIMERAGQICNLERQIKYHLMVNGIKIGDYIADFRYVITGLHPSIETIEDTKGFVTPLCRWKLKHMAAQGTPVTLWPEPKPKPRKARRKATK